MHYKLPRKNGKLPIMKIAYVLDDTLDKTDGVQQAVLTIARYMASLGHDVHYIVPETHRTDLPNVHVISRYIQMKFNGNSVRTPLPAPRRTIKKLLLQEKFDVLHVQMPYSPVLAGRVVRLAPASTVIVGTFHILPYNAFARIGTRLLGFWLRENLKKFTRFYAVSEPARVFMAQTCGVDGKVLGNPLNYQFFHSFARSKETQPGKKSTLVYVGRFDVRKGVLQLIKAYEAMAEREQCELIMCGKGPLLDEAVAYAQEKALSIQFPGFVSEEEKATYLANADIAVFPSLSGESFGIVLTEAMASGAGITLGGNNPGYASVLSHWPETLLDPSNIKVFAQKLDYFVRNTASRREIGDAQHTYVKEFDIAVIAKHLLEEGYVKK